MTMQADYVIVGSGSAGSALAARLSEDGRTPFSCSNMAARMSARSSRCRRRLLADEHEGYNWGYLSEPEPNLNNRRITAPRGKVIGGSSSINGMVYVRGSAEDFRYLGRAWRDRLGLCDVLPYFKRQENSRGGQAGWRGTDGPLHVQRGRQKPAGARLCRGGPRGRVRDDGKTITARSRRLRLMEQTIHEGKRWSAASAYLKPALKRPNVDLLRCFARRVVFEGKRAVGVEVDRGGKIEVVRANREVIVSPPRPSIRRSFSCFPASARRRI